MASVLVAAVPFNGHVTPLLAVAGYLAGRGDRVRFITGPRFADAVRATGAEFIPLTGVADIDDLQDWNVVFPERARLKGARALAYDELLPRTDVFVTNGGYGGVQYALKHGVPIFTTGGLEDKPEVAARVAYSGVGRRIDSERPGAAAVGRAVREVLADPRYRHAAQRVAASMAAAGGLPAVAGIVDGLVSQSPG